LMNIELSRAIRIVLYKRKGVKPPDPMPLTEAALCGLDLVPVVVIGPRRFSDAVIILVRPPTFTTALILLMKYWSEA
jgi:hypothetical protein